MTVLIQNDAAGAGAGTLLPDLAFTHFALISNLDTGLGLGAAAGNQQPLTYTRTDPGVPATRLDALVNTAFGTDIVTLAVGGDFVLNDGTPITAVGGTALPPAGSGLPGADLNTTAFCLVIYDTTDNGGAGYCLARDGSGGVMDLRLPLSVMLYHELSHAFRIVTGGLLPLSNTCNPSSQEENAAIVDENDMRTQLAAMEGVPAVLRDPGIHCGVSCGGGGGGSCCVVASVTSGSPLSAEVQELRSLRDQFLRRSEVGFGFFDALHRAYYAFSPQVVTVMAADLDVRGMVLDGVVRPLVRTLQLVRDRAMRGSGAGVLGERIVAEAHGRGLDALAVASRVAGLVSGPAAGALGDAAAGMPGDASESALGGAETAVARLLAERALPDPHVSWALVEPVLAYHRLVAAARAGATADDVGARFVEFVDDWAARLPIDARWGAFDLATARRELDALAATLLREPRAMRVFLRRLDAEHGTATAISTAVAERSAT